MEVTKYSGAGNTFFILFFKDVAPDQRKLFTQNICLQKKADGVLFIDQQQEEYIWDFYNADGSTAEMCGNAARCAVLFLKQQKVVTQSKFNFLTLAGKIQVSELKNQQYQVEMPEVVIKNQKLIVSFEGIKIQGFWVQAGVPHFVIEEQSYEQDLRTYAREVRKHALFAPQGTNVTFVRQKMKNELVAITFERGVEDFTLACGTGAVAAAVWSRSQTKESGVYKVQMPGGKLEVDLTNPQRPLLIGGAEKKETVIWSLL